MIQNTPSPIKIGMTFLKSKTDIFLIISPPIRPERTIKGTFPSIIIPKTGLRGSRKFSNFQSESIFIARKNKANKDVLRIESRQRT